jgi:hypothetical protein
LACDRPAARAEEMSPMPRSFDLTGKPSWFKNIFFLLRAASVALFGA